MLQRALAVILATVALGAVPSADAQQRRQQQAPAAPPPPQRLPWTGNAPERPPEGAIGLAAIRPRYCSSGLYGSFGLDEGIYVLVLNRTEHTIRFANVTAELVFMDRQEIVSFNIQFADPGEERRIRLGVPGGCQGEAVILRVREIRLCERQVRWPAGCGARFVAYAPNQYAWVGTNSPAFEVRFQLD